MRNRKVLAQFKVIFRSFPRGGSGLRKQQKKNIRIARLWVKIWIHNLPNTTEVVKHTTTIFCG
jgi:hypothetical protein